MTSPIPGFGSEPPRLTDGYSGTRVPGLDSTAEPGNYGPSLFGVALPQGTGAPGTPGASALPEGDTTNEPGQVFEAFSGQGPDVIADTGAPGTTGAQNDSGGPDRVTFTRPGSYLTGTYEQDTISDSVSGPSDWTQAIDGSYGGPGPDLPGVAGNQPAGTGAGQGRVLRGGRGPRA